MINKFILDTNILIRFLTNDSKEQSLLVENLFKKVANKSLIVPDVVLIETVFVLLSVYELAKEEIVEKMSSLIAFEKFDLHKTLFQKTLDLYGKYPISIVDAYLGAVSKTKPTQTIYTFDKKMQGIKEIRAQNPTNL